MKQRAVSEILADRQEPSIDGIIVIDQFGTVLTFDAAAQELFGYHEEEILNQPLTLLMSDAQKKPHKNYIERANQRHATSHKALHLKQTIIGKHKQGHSIPLAITVSQDTSSDQIHYTGVIQDLRKHESQLTQLFQDFQTNTQALSQRIEFEEILNRHGNQLLSCEDKAFYSTMEQALQGVGQFLHLDHGYILQLSADVSQAQLWAEWRRSVHLMKPFPSRFTIPNSPATLSVFATQKTLVLSEENKHEHRELYQLAQQLSPNGFLTTRISPIFSDQKTLVGCIGFSTLDQGHHLDEAEVSLLNLATQMLVNAWGRHQLILVAREAEEKIRAKNKLLANKAAFSQTLLRTSNALFLAERKEFANAVKEVLLQAALISGHQQASLYFNQQASAAVTHFLQQYLDHDQLSLAKNKTLIGYIENKLQQEDIFQLENLSFGQVPSTLQDELKSTRIEGFTAVKLCRGKHYLGFICFYNSLPVLNSNEENLRFLQLTGQALTSAIEHHGIQNHLELSEQNLTRANALLSQQALQDALTGLANRRAFDHAIEQEFDRAMRHNDQLTLLMCDIDYFKRYNDYFGHPQGDVCLQQVAKVMQSTFNRAGELCARYGGEEFAILLPSISSEEAKKQAQRLLDKLYNCHIEHAPDAASDYLSISIGIAQYSQGSNKGNYTGHADLIEAADKALYQAKNNGRNQLAWANEAE
jgi:diguanylate cyclase (GGDEF)-like protein/PAS domain S-box-containing protein